MSQEEKLYASALILYCKNNKVPEKDVYKQMKSLHFSGNAEEAKALSGIIQAAKLKLKRDDFANKIDESLSQLDLITPIKNIVKTSLQKYGNMSLFESVFKDFARKINVTNVSIQLAVSNDETLDEPTKNKINEMLAKKFDDKVNISCSANKNLISGLVMIVNSQKTDTTTLSKINKLSSDLCDSTVNVAK